MPAKKQVKKTVKKTVKKVVLPVFNKKNTLALADSIHTDKGGRVSFVKLCDGKLRTKSGSLVMHCAVGEAYYNFVSRSLTSVFKYDSTSEAIHALVERAKLKKGVSQDELEEVLDKVVEVNDSKDTLGCNLSEPHFVTVLEDRARKVADYFRREVAPLLA